jgi:hypothetical protein
MKPISTPEVFPVLQAGPRGRGSQCRLARHASPVPSRPVDLRRSGIAPVRVRARLPSTDGRLRPACS